MRRFRFRLDRVEQVRRVERNRARARLVEANAELEALRRRIEGFERGAMTALQDLAERLAPGAQVDGRVLRELGDGLQQARGAAGRLRDVERAAAAELAGVQQEYVECSRAHRSLVRLRARRKAEWQIEAEREEQRVLDELHLLRLDTYREKGRS